MPCLSPWKKILLPTLLLPGILFYQMRSLEPASAADTGPRAPLKREYQLTAGKSVVIQTPVEVKRVSVGNPEIADFVLLSPTEIYTTAKAVGTTNLTVWAGGRVLAIYDLTVAVDLNPLKEALYRIMPQEKELRVNAVKEAVTLSGRVTDSRNMERALVLARSFAPKGKVNNLVEVGGVHQVMLEVRVAEISRSTTKRLGINFNYIKNNGEFGFSLLGGLTGFEFDDDEAKMLISPAVNALFRFNSGNTTWTGFVDALKADGLAKVLAEPTLIALSGQTASFLAGGEFPIPVPDDNGITITYKEFGVGLNFTPTVLGAERINIRVTPEVSELDFSNAVQFSGYVAPGLTTRRATTTIELKDGQSFAVAGLLRENIVEDVQKFPILGDIPILGALFRSERFQKYETELIIVVTPKLVKPLDMARRSLPTDFYVEPDDYEFFLEGRLEGRPNRAPKGLAGQMDGSFGHFVPDPETPPAN